MRARRPPTSRRSQRRTCSTPNSSRFKQAGAPGRASSRVELRGPRGGEDLRQGTNRDPGPARDRLPGRDRPGRLGRVTRDHQRAGPAPGQPDRHRGRADPGHSGGARLARRPTTSRSRARADVRPGRTDQRVEAKAQVQEMRALGVTKLYVADDGSPYGEAIAARGQAGAAAEHHPRQQLGSPAPTAVFYGRELARRARREVFDARPRETRRPSCSGPRRSTTRSSRA